MRGEQNKKDFTVVTTTLLIRLEATRSQTLFKWFNAGRVGGMVRVQIM